MKVNDTSGNTQDIQGVAQYIPSSFLAPVMSSGGTGYLTRIVGAIGHVLMGGARWVGQRQARHQMWRELQGMSEHTLKDLGIGRDQIDSVVKGAFATKPAGHMAKAANNIALRSVATAANDDTVTRAA